MIKADYDENSDILYIYKKGKVKYSIDLGVFVLDVNEKNQVVGIELLDATQLLKSTIKALEHIKEVNFNVTKRGSSISAVIEIKVPKLQPLNVVLSSPLPQQKVPLLVAN